MEKIFKGSYAFNGLLACFWCKSFVSPASHDNYVCVVKSFASCNLRSEVGSSVDTKGKELKAVGVAGKCVVTLVRNRRFSEAFDVCLNVSDVDDERDRWNVCALSKRGRTSPYIVQNYFQQFSSIMFYNIGNQYYTCVEL